MFWRQTRKTPAPPALTDGLRIYAVGDIHGRLDLLDRVLQAIEVDLRERPVADHLLIFLGDYIDRGPDSAGVLDRLIEIRSHHQTICLKGNHEALLLEALAQPSSLEAWTAVGGLSTLMSYGFNPQGSLDAEKAQALVSSFVEALPPAHRDFLTALSLTYEIDDYFFVHAGVKPKVALAAQREDDLIWIRDEFLLHERPFDKYIVHGHTPMREPDVRSNRMNIDTGAFATSKLTCVAFEGSQHRFLT